MGQHIPRVADVVTNLSRRGLLATAERTAAEYRVSLKDVLSCARHRNASKARRHLWTLIRDSLDLSYPEIGSLFGVDHTSVLNAVRKRHVEIEREHAS